jgi:flagellar hook-associated protein 1 FlgK
MASTFFGLTIGYSGLNAFNASINTTANNIANKDTDGYSRQQVTLTQAESLRVKDRYGTAGSGVSASSIEQIRDQYYDVKYWTNNTKLSEYDSKLYYLDQIETYFKDDGSDGTVEGFSTIFNNLTDVLDSLKTHAAESEYRSQLVSSAQIMMTYFNSMYDSLNSLQYEINEVIRTDVDEINGIAEKIAALNKQINIIEQQGGAALELRDERALLLDDLSEYVPIETTETVVSEFPYTTSFRVKINGQTLVDGNDYRQLYCKEREGKVNQTDADGLINIYWKDYSGYETNNRFELSGASMTGELKALYDIRDGNNGDYFHGTFDKDASTNTEIVIKDTNMNNINEVTINQQGIITIGTKEYSYSGFEVRMGDDGYYEYTFTLSDGMSDEEMARYAGRTAKIGEDVGTMGIPYYMAQMSLFVRSYATAFNNLHTSGYDLNGDQGGNFFTATNSIDGMEWQFEDQEKDTTKISAGDLIFTSTNDTYYQMTAQNIVVSEKLIDDPSLVVTATDVTNGVTNADIVEQYLLLNRSDELFRGGSSGDFLECIISDIAVDKQKVQIFSDNYSNVVDSIISQRMSVSGVDEDEEGINMIKFQNAYNLSSQIIQVLSEMYDRLILETGV